jgi:predicted MPP superfamily phosphohydrolase
LAGAGVLIAAIAAYAAGVEPYQLRVNRKTLYCPHLPESFEGLRILLLSDLHSSRYGRREKLVANVLAETAADIVAFTGDLVHTPHGIPVFFNIASSIKTDAHVYAVFGNSEHKNGVRPYDLAEQMRGAGITPLINASTVVSRGSESIAIIGVDDPASGHHDFVQAFKGVDRDMFQILLMHSPDTIALACAYDADIVLSGHTHGGQIRIPGYGAPYTHSRLGRRMSSGLYKGRQLQSLIGFRPRRTQLFVTRGVGVSGLAVRFFCPPEVNVITLTHHPDHNPPFKGRSAYWSAH